MQHRQCAIYDKDMACQGRHVGCQGHDGPRPARLVRMAGTKTNKLKLSSSTPSAARQVSSKSGMLRLSMPSWQGIGFQELSHSGTPKRWQHWTCRLCDEHIDFNRLWGLTSTMRKPKFGVNQQCAKQEFNHVGVNSRYANQHISDVSTSPLVHITRDGMTASTKSPHFDH